MGDREEAEIIAEMDRAVQADRDRLQTELADILECLKENESRIREKEALDQAEENERIAKVNAERKRKAKNDRALKRNERRLAGDTDVPDTDEEEAEIAAAEAAAEAAANAAPAAEDASVRSGSKAAASSPAPSRKPSHASVSAVTGPPPASRGGTK